jgi:hypothetical protein
MTVEIRDGWLHGSLPDDTGKEWPIVRHPQTSARGPLATDVPNLILHTTETDGYVETLKFPSQWQCGEEKIGQHIKLGLAGDSVNTWDGHAQQIEMVGRSRLERWLPREETLGPVVALTAWLHKTDRIKTGLKRPALWPVVLDKGPQAVTSYYRRHAGVWPGTAGVYGHVEIPDNSHWDPGSFDYPRFFARVQAAIDGGDEDMGFEDYKEGQDAFLDGKSLGDEWPPDKKRGWKAENRVKKAAETPEPGTPGPHDHNLIGKAQ